VTAVLSWVLHTTLGMRLASPCTFGASPKAKRRDIRRTRLGATLAICALFLLMRETCFLP